MLDDDDDLLGPDNKPRLRSPVTITVTGPRLSGKTTTAMRLVALLRAMGFAAEFRGRSRAHEQHVRDRLLVGGGLVDGRLPQSFVVEDRT